MSRQRSTRGHGLAENTEERWTNLTGLDELSDEESRARHGRMMAVVARRIDAIVKSLKGRA